MQQKINPQNGNQQSAENKNSIISRILKPKGKPFWLNLSSSRTKNYEKFKSQSQMTLVDKNIQVKIQNTSSLNLSVDIDEEKYIEESVQSFNQNYDEDFESYKSTINQDNKEQKKLLKFIKNQSRRQNLPQYTSRQDTSLDKITIKAPNLFDLSKDKVDSKNHKRPFRYKTQFKPKKDEERFNAQRELYLHQNTMYLKNQNEKMIRKIQQMRNLIPLILRNQQSLCEQSLQLNSLRETVRRAISPEYEYGIDQSRLEACTNKKFVQKSIKKLNSPKNQRKRPIIINDDVIFSFHPVSIIRQQLMSKIRLNFLKQNQTLILDKKINLYEQIINKISTKEKIQSYSSLQRRKIFLQWDISRLKNDFDLKILEEQIQIQYLKDEIQSFDLMIFEKSQSIEETTKRQQSTITEKQLDEIRTLNPQVDTHQSAKNESPTHKALRKFIFNKNILTHQPKIKSQNQPSTNISFSQEKQQESQRPIIHQIPFISIAQSPKMILWEKQQTFRHKKYLQKSIKNISIRIKKSTFRNQSIADELEELKL